MLEVCRLSPAPAVLIVQRPEGAGWECNPACESWYQVSRWSREEWARLCRRVLAAAGHHQSVGEDAALGVGWRSVATDEGLLTWLLPVGASAETRLFPLSPLDALLLESASAATRHMGLGLWRASLRHEPTRPDPGAFFMSGVSGKPVEEVPLAALRAAVHPEDLPTMELAGWAAQQPGAGVVDAQARFKRADGSWRTVQTRRMAERDSNGRSVAVVGVAFDITEEAAARQRAEAQSQAMRMVTEATGLGWFTIDLVHETTHWYGALQRMLEVVGPDTTSLALAKQLFFDRVPDDLRDEVMRKVDAFFQPNAEAGELTCPVRTQAGGLRWLQVNLWNRKHEGWNDLFGVVMDVTAQREAKDRLVNAEKRALIATQLAGFGVWQTDPVTGESIWDDRIYRLLGLKPDDPRSRPEILKALIEPQDLVRLNDYAAMVVEREARPGAAVAPATSSVEFRVNLPDGHQRWLCSRGTLLEGEAGHRLLLGLCWDITDHKTAEQLRMEHAAAEEGSRAKSEFLANVSHEIRTPMNAILGMAHLALRSGLNPQQYNYVLKVDRSARSLLGLINDILDFSKIEAGKLEIERIDFRLGDVLEHLANLVGLQAEDKGLELLFEQPMDLPPVLVGDPLRLGQVLVNLGSNAVKFTAKGEVVVSVELVQREAAAAWVRFCVRDTGPGIPPEQQRRLFQPFTQADASTSRRHGGTGLGLAVSRRLVDLMGGSMEVRSSPGEGSAFSFTLPLGVGRESDDDGSSGLRADLRRRRVLVVDDNATARQILVELSAELGMVADAAVDGLEALKAVDRASDAGHPYDVVLLDWRMPGMDGVACARELRRAPHPVQPVILMTTGFGREEVLERLAAEGVQVTDVLVKPVTPSTLLDAFASALGRPERQHAAALAGADQPVQRESLRGARVLLVEDNEINQELATELLAGSGLEVVVAENGQRALEMLAEGAYDGVLMDCQMPLMDGYTATRHIRADPRWARLPIIAMTANAMSGDREQALAAGMNDHIAKPLDVETMFDKLARWIRPGQGL